MKGTMKQRPAGRSKPSQASLVSRGLAANPAITRYKEGEGSGPPSVRSGYSLYSSDSEDTTKDVNQGLNRCAKLLANIMDTSGPAQPIRAGQATYKHQAQKSKTSSKPHKSRFSKQDTKVSKHLPKDSAQAKATRAPRVKAPVPKNSRKKDTVVHTAVTTSQARRKGQPSGESGGQKKAAVVHIIPTGSNSLADKPTTRPKIVHKEPASSKNATHVLAPGFQDCLMSSTPTERQSPQKPEDIDRSQALHGYKSPREGFQQASLAKQHSSVGKQSSKDDHPIGLRERLPEHVGTGGRSGESSIPVIGSETERCVPIGSRQSQEQDMDWMKWYEESIAKQTIYEGLARGHGNKVSGKTSLGQDQNQSQSEEKVSNTRSSSSIASKQQGSQGLDKIHHQQPLQDSQDLLRGLVQQLTILNQGNPNSVPLSNTQDLLQGLIRKDGGRIQPRSLEGDTDEEMDLPRAPHTGTQQSLPIDQERKPHGILPKSSDAQPSLSQLLTEFRQVPPQPSGTTKEIATGRIPLASKLLEEKSISDQPPLSSGTGDALPTRDDHSSGPQAQLGVSSPQDLFHTPERGYPSSDDDALDQVSTPYVHKASHIDAAQTVPGKYIQVGDPAVDAHISPPRVTETLMTDPRGQAVKQRSMQQIRVLKYLIGELQSLLGDHDDLEVFRLLSEVEEVCNTLPYTTQKQLLDLNTEVLLALQPLQSENSQLRRRLRIANHQLKSREIAEKERKDEATVSLEALTLQALNANLQKQLREERREKEEMMKSNLEISKTLEEKEHQHQNMLRILDDKDTNLLKSRQDCLKELQDLREVRTELQSKVDYLDLQVEGLNKEIRILQLSLQQRDNEVAKLKTCNENLQEKVRKLISPSNGGSTSPRTIGGMSLQRMNRLLMERSPNKANKENIQDSSHILHSATTPSKRYLAATERQYDPSKHGHRSPVYDESFPVPPKKSPVRQVQFMEGPDHKHEDIWDWARTDTLWKDQQTSSDDLIQFESSEELQETDPVGMRGAELNSWMDKRRSPLTPRQELHNKHKSPRSSDRLFVSENTSPATETQKREAFHGLSPELVTLPRQESFENTDNPASSSSAGFGQRLSSPSLLNSLNTRDHYNYKPLSGVPGRLEAASVISDSTVSSITSQYEAKFQSGLRDLDAEIGKLQASLKYSAYKS